MVETKKLIDIADVFDSLHQTPEYVDTGVPMVRVTDVKPGDLTLEGCQFVTDEIFEKFTASHVPQKGDIVISRVGTYGNFSYVAENLKFCLGQNTSIIVPKINSRYLYYYLQSPFARAQIESRVVGSTQKTLSLKNIKELEIPCPSRSIQDKIASFLETIDLKIGTNNRINRNLQEQAQVYFDELFDVTDTPNGTLSDMGCIVAGGTPSKAKPEYYAEDGIAWITPKDLSIDKSVFIYHGENDISELGYSKSSATKMPAGTVLFSSRAPIGYIAIAGNEVTTNQGFKSVIPNDGVSSAYIYFLLKRLLPTIESMASGSTFKEISGSAMKVVPISIPDGKLLERFATFCDPLFEQIRKLELESKRLISLRDSLLPKLMSGELDVSDIDI